MMTHFHATAKMLLVSLAGDKPATPGLSRRVAPPGPDNAASLYRQAFLLLATWDAKAARRIDLVAKGERAPDATVRQYLQGCCEAIERVEAAARVPACNWEAEFSPGPDDPVPHLTQMRRLAFVLVADARVRTADGDYRGALERCLMMRPFARHLAGDRPIASLSPTIQYLSAVASLILGYRCMVDVIGPASDEASLLRWLKDEVVTASDLDLRVIRPFKIEMGLMIDLMRMENLSGLIEALYNSYEDESIAEFRAVANEEMLTKARKLYSARMRSALKALSTPMSYEQLHARLRKIEKETDTDDPASALAESSMPALSALFGVQIRTETLLSAVRAGTEICLWKGEMGRLPHALPPGLPKDPFSGEDFEYERTAEGFTLRCRVREFKTERLHEFVFALR